MSSIVIQGDTSGSITVEAPSVAGTHTLTLPKATGNIATDTTVGLGTKNLIINGDMRIAQRGTSATITGSGFGYFLIDRFGVQAEDDGSGYNVSQSTDAPAGFQYSMLLTVTTTDTLDATSDNHCLGQRIEGNNIAHLKWGTSDAETVTLSFWVKSSLTGTFGGALSNLPSTSRAYGFIYTINSANTWEYKTITISGETTGTWATNNGIGIWVTWSLGANAGRQTTANQWDTIASRQATGVYGEDNIIGTLGATFYITGVQLEVGENATPFEHRMYSQELAMCQRYALLLGDGLSGQARTTSSTFLCPSLYQQMRATPTVTITDTSVGISDNYAANFTSSGSTADQVDMTSFGGRISVSGFTGLTVGRSYTAFGNTNGSIMLLSAEL